MGTKDDHVGMSLMYLMANSLTEHEDSIPNTMTTSHTGPPKIFRYGVKDTFNMLFISNGCLKLFSLIYNMVHHVNTFIR